MDPEAIVRHLLSVALLASRTGCHRAIPLRACPSSLGWLLHAVLLYVAVLGTHKCQRHQAGRRWPYAGA